MGHCPFFRQLPPLPDPIHVKGRVPVQSCSELPQAIPPREEHTACSPPCVQGTSSSASLVKNPISSGEREPRLAELSNERILTKPRRGCSAVRHKLRAHTQS